MKTLYVIGNGFDRAHGLPTAYLDFREFLETTDETFLYTFEDVYGINMPDFDDWHYGGKNPDDLKTVWLKGHASQYLWGDFEHNLGYSADTYIHSVGVAAADGLDEAYHESRVESTMRFYMKQQFGFIEKLQDYLSRWVKSIDYSTIKTKHSRLVNNRHDMFLTFNYTPTLQVIYGINHERIKHIHGGLSDYTSRKPIIGHGNKKTIRYYREQADQAQSWGKSGSYIAICNAIAEFFEESLKPVDEIIESEQEYFRSLRDVTDVQVIGMSLSDVDLPYVLKLKRSVRKDARWSVFYHGDSSDRQFKALKSLRFPNCTQILRPSTEFWDA